MSTKKENVEKDLPALVKAASGDKSTDTKSEVVIANALRQQLISSEEVVVRSIGTFHRAYSKDLFAIEKREKPDKTPFYYIDTTREGLYDMLPEGVFHQTLKKDAQPDTEAAVDELKLHQEEEKAARQFFLPLEQEFYRLQMLAEWRESTLLFSSLDQTQYQELIDLWELPDCLTTYQAIMMLHIIPLLHRVVGVHTATSNLLSALLEIPVTVEPFTFAQPVEGVDFPPLGAFQLGKDSVLGNCLEDYHPNYRIIVGPMKKKYITNYLPGGKGRPTLMALLAYFLPCQSDVSLSFEVEREEDGFLLDPSQTEEGYLGYTTHL